MGRVKKQVFDAPMSEVEAILKEYEVPSPSELGKAGSYIQTTTSACPARSWSRRRSWSKPLSM
ncbi:MAG: hypothetical protein ABSG85_18065 [Spirochaetia bacterium]